MAEHNQFFETHQKWVQKASSWLTRYHGKAICFDTKGRHLETGGDFRRAKDEDAFPVRWVWDWQVAAALSKFDPISFELFAEAYDTHEEQE